MSRPIKVLPGSPTPLGPTLEKGGVNFALFSANASKVELCLFDPSRQFAETRIIPPECTNQVWHGFVDGIRPGQLYGYRVPLRAGKRRRHCRLPETRLFADYIVWGRWTKLAKVSDRSITPSTLSVVLLSKLANIVAVEGEALPQLRVIIEGGHHFHPRRSPVFIEGGHPFSSKWSPQKAASMARAEIDPGV